jgi:integrase/recombinase XerD
LSPRQGKLATRTIPVIEDLRSLLTLWQPRAGKIYLFPGRHPNHHWWHITSDSAARCLREACQRVGIEGASTHSFRRTALIQMSNAGIPLRVIQQVSGHRTLTELQKYLEVSDAQVRGAVSALSMLSYGGIAPYADAELELPQRRSIQSPESLKNPVVDTD